MSCCSRQIDTFVDAINQMTVNMDCGMKHSFSASVNNSIYIGHSDPDGHHSMTDSTRSHFGNMFLFQGNSTI